MALTWFYLHPTRDPGSLSIPIHMYGRIERSALSSRSVSFFDFEALRDWAWGGINVEMSTLWPPTPLPPSLPISLSVERREEGGEEGRRRGERGERRDE